MSKPDTNQVSGDELRAEILTEFKQVHKLAPADYTENCTNVVMSIIRTEKLKLLAEVRERVVGEDDVLVDIPIVDGTGKTISIVDRSFTTYMMVKNHLRAEQRTKLAKLEAEL